MKRRKFLQLGVGGVAAAAMPSLVVPATPELLSGEMGHTLGIGVPTESEHLMLLDIHQQVMKIMKADAKRVLDVVAYESFTEIQAKENPR